MLVWCLWASTYVLDKPAVSSSRRNKSNVTSWMKWDTEECSQETEWSDTSKGNAVGICSHVLPFLCISFCARDRRGSHHSRWHEMLVSHVVLCACNTSQVLFCWSRPSLTNIEVVPYPKLHNLILSSFQGSEQCLELLIRHFGPSIVNLRDHRGRTPLHVAAFHNNMDCMQLLLSSGANVEARDVTGKTPLLVAASSGQCNAVGEYCPHFNCTKYSWVSMKCLVCVHWIEDLNFGMS
jgi:hypothetical protein